MTCREQFLTALEHLQQAAFYLDNIRNSELEPKIEEVKNVIKELNKIPRDSAYWEDFQ